MIAVNELKGIIVSRGLSQKKVARHLNLSEKTFYSKMKKGIFNSDEIKEMVNYLNISDPMSIFFADIGTCCAPNEMKEGLRKEKPAIARVNCGRC